MGDNRSFSRFYQFNPETTRTTQFWNARTFRNGASVMRGGMMEDSTSGCFAGSFVGRKFNASSAAAKDFENSLEYLLDDLSSSAANVRGRDNALPMATRQQRHLSIGCCTNLIVPETNIQQNNTARSCLNLSLNNSTAQGPNSSSPQLSPGSSIYSSKSDTASVPVSQGLLIDVSFQEPTYQMRNNRRHIRPKSGYHRKQVPKIDDFLYPGSLQKANSLLEISNNRPSQDTQNIRQSHSMTFNSDIDNMLSELDSAIEELHEFANQMSSADTTKTNINPKSQSNNSTITNRAINEMNLSSRNNSSLVVTDNSLNKKQSRPYNEAISARNSNSSLTKTSDTEQHNTRQLLREFESLYSDSDTDASAITDFSSTTVCSSMNSEAAPTIIVSSTSAESLYSSFSSPSLSLSSSSIDDTLVCDYDDESGFRSMPKDTKMAHLDESGFKSMPNDTKIPHFDGDKLKIEEGFGIIDKNKFEPMSTGTMLDRFNSDSWKIEENSNEPKYDDIRSDESLSSKTSWNFYDMRSNLSQEMPEQSHMTTFLPNQNLNQSKANKSSKVQIEAKPSVNDFALPTIPPRTTSIQTNPKMKRSSFTAQENAISDSSFQTKGALIQSIPDKITQPNLKIDANFKQNQSVSNKTELPQSSRNITHATIEEKVRQWELGNKPPLKAFKQDLLLQNVMSSGTDLSVISDSDIGYVADRDTCTETPTGQRRPSWKDEDIAFPVAFKPNTSNTSVNKSNLDECFVYQQGFRPLKFVGTESRYMIKASSETNELRIPTPIKLRKEISTQTYDVIHSDSSSENNNNLSCEERISHLVTAATQTDHDISDYSLGSDSCRVGGSCGTKLQYLDNQTKQQFCTALSVSPKLVSGEYYNTPMPPLGQVTKHASCKVSDSLNTQQSSLTTTEAAKNSAIFSRHHQNVDKMSDVNESWCQQKSRLSINNNSITTTEPQQNNKPCILVRHEPENTKTYTHDAALPMINESDRKTVPPPVVSLYTVRSRNRHGLTRSTSMPVIPRQVHDGLHQQQQGPFGISVKAPQPLKKYSSTLIIAQPCAKTDSSLNWQGKAIPGDKSSKLYMHQSSNEFATLSGYKLPQRREHEVIGFDAHKQDGVKSTANRTPHPFAVTFKHSSKTDPPNCINSDRNEKAAAAMKTEPNSNRYLLTKEKNLNETLQPAGINKQLVWKVQKRSSSNALILTEEVPAKAASAKTQKTTTELSGHPLTNHSLSDHSLTDHPKPDGVDEPKGHSLVVNQGGRVLITRHSFADSTQSAVVDTSADDKNNKRFTLSFCVAKDEKNKKCNRTLPSVSEIRQNKADNKGPAVCRIINITPQTNKKAVCSEITKQKNEQIENFV